MKFRCLRVSLPAVLDDRRNHPFFTGWASMTANHCRLVVMAALDHAPGRGTLRFISNSVDDAMVGRADYHA
jgi:hypothetical protein